MGQQVVLITGGSSGYGKAMARLFTEAGYRVLITARNRERLEEVRQSIGCDAFVMDVIKPSDWKELYDYVISTYGHLDILINNAGGGVAFKETVKLTIDEVDETIALNLSSVIYGAKTFAPLLLERKQGTIINISSVVAKEAWPGWSAYAASKWGVLGYSKGLYTELQPHGVRVTCVIPARASTGFQRNAGIGEVVNKLQASDVAQTVFDICKLPAHVVVEEVTVWGIDQIVVPL